MSRRLGEAVAATVPTRLVPPSSSRFDPESDILTMYSVGSRRHVCGVNQRLRQGQYGIARSKTNLHELTK